MHGGGHAVGGEDHRLGLRGRRLPPRRTPRRAPRGRGRRGRCGRSACGRRPGRRRARARARPSRRLAPHPRSSPAGKRGGLFPPSAEESSKPRKPAARGVGATGSLVVMLSALGESGSHRPVPLNRNRLPAGRKWAGRPIFANHNFGVVAQRSGSAGCRGEHDRGEDDDWRARKCPWFKGRIRGFTR